MVLRFLSLALLLGAVPLAAQVTSRTPTRSTVPDAVQGHPGWFGFRQDTGRDSLVVLEVAPGSPAERAGLRKGDRITMINGRIATPRLLGEKPPMVGETRAIAVRRGNDTLTFVMVAASPPPDALIQTRAALTNADTVAREARALRSRMTLKATRATGVIPSHIDTLSAIDSLSLIVDSLSLILDQRPRVMLTDSSGNRRSPLTTGQPLIIVDGAIVSPGLYSELVRHMQHTNDSIIDSPALYAELERSLQQTNDLMATLGRRENAVAGAELEQLNSGLAEYFGGVAEGVFVLRVAEATPAANAGLRPGDIVQTVNGQRVPTMAALRDAVSAAAGPITLRVLRKGKAVTVMLRKQ